MDPGPEDYDVLCVNYRMVLVPFQRVTRRLLGFFVIVLALVTFFLLFWQMHHIYHKHLKLRRFETYSQYVDDVTNDMVKLEALANNSNLNMDQFLLVLGQNSIQSKENSINLLHDRSNTSKLLTTR